MSLGKCCISGFKHDGTPVGAIEEINGVRTYVTLPKGDYDKTKAVLFLTDIFGIDTLPNGLLLADSYAANGYATYMPDLLNGDPVPMDAFQKGEFDLGAWFPHHGADVTRPPIDKVLRAMRDKGFTKVAAIGFCFGARYVVDLVLDNAVQAAMVAHPSLLEVPADIEKLKQSSVPFLWNNAGDDHGGFNPDVQKQARAILEGSAAHKWLVWDKVDHGFAIRGDPSDETQRKAADGAFEATVQFFNDKL
ncbi:hypothetical protein Rhopal_007135-T1 [Rhodotorula paludigena]|uniref:Dienelactone hydrolase domain-containing protein n=1 Tax=Rhodotorula paludigena TaxID=86838 RepID=A0AAV5GNZ7_9BASI|nr:hypothetical protein Rhopal_007135-T1 [Rhodotorula paludigena]